MQWRRGGAASANQFVCKGLQGYRYLQSERIRGGEIDDELIGRWLLDWQLGRQLPAKDLVNVKRRALEQHGHFGRIRKQAACARKLRELVARGKSPTCSHLHDSVATR